MEVPCRDVMRCGSASMRAERESGLCLRVGPVAVTGDNEFGFWSTAADVARVSVVSWSVCRGLL